MDKTDIQILKHLQIDAKLSMVELAERVNLTQTPCARRVQNLEKLGVVEQYVGLLNHKKVGLPVNAFVELSLKREDAQVVPEFESGLLHFPEVMECYALSGGHDYLLRVVAPDLDAYHSFLKEKLLTLRGVEGLQTSFALSRLIYRTALPLNHLPVSAN
ncbi:MAG: Lrp/AsnC family leucine-responsive transcriptional regulator [Candidatus Azotimanducaceae bacterium]|jgi:Lrp/AsnC family leucine-responsive transcriptional regulator